MKRNIKLLLLLFITDDAFENVYLIRRRQFKKVFYCTLKAVGGLILFHNFNGSLH